MKKKRFIWINLIILVCGITYMLYRLDSQKRIKVDKDFSKIELDTINRLMIVAHPDDETLWGGSDLINEDYLVVCITCGVNKTRVKEFEKVMKQTNDEYIMLGYPDKTNGKRDDWEKCQDDLMKDLNDIINLKDWDVIVTHNPDGEYGHEHHKMTSQFVSELVSKKDKLLYFGRYYSKDAISVVESNLPRLDDATLNIKVNQLLSVYKSQKFLEEKFSQMYPYENLIPFERWEEEE